VCVCGALIVCVCRGVLCVLLDYFVSVCRTFLCVR